METIGKMKIQEKAQEIVQNNENTVVRVTSNKKATFLMFAILKAANLKTPRTSITQHRLHKKIIMGLSFDSDQIKMHYKSENRKLYITFPENDDFDPKLKEQMSNLIPKSLHKKLQKDNSAKNTDQITVPVKLFNAMGAGTWYIYEHVENDIYMAFVNLDDPQMAEIGTVSLSELAGLESGMFGLPIIERDNHFKPMKLQTIIDKVKSGNHV